MLKEELLFSNLITLEASERLFLRRYIRPDEEEDLQEAACKNTSH